MKVYGQLQMTDDRCQVMAKAHMVF